MKLTLDIADEIVQAYADTYGYVDESEADVQTFAQDSLETYMENFWAGHQSRQAESAARAPFAEKQALRAERAAPAKVAEEAPGAEPVKERIR